MRNFFQQTEIDDDPDGVFEVSNNTNTNLSRTEISNISNENNQTIASHIMMDQCSENIENEQKSDESISLCAKLEKVFDRYCNIMKIRKNRWNELNLNYNSSVVIDTEKLPSTLKDFYLQKSMNNNSIYGTNINNWTSLTAQNRMNIASLMSLLRIKQQQSMMPNRSNCSSFGVIDEKEESKNSLEVYPFDSENISLSLQTDHQSKYASQLIPQAQFQPETEQMEKIASSTPNKNSIYQHNLPIDSPITNNPAAKPLQCSNKKRKHKNYLEFLCLRTIDDLFSDDDEPNHIKQTEISKSFRQLKFNDDDDNVVDESQYTVSRVLKICEEAEQNVETSNSSSTKHHKQLNIGNINDLFCDDGNASDCTVDYDVTEILPKQQNILNDNIAIQSKSVNSNGKTITRLKSDDLFSIFNESFAKNTMRSDTTNKNVNDNYSDEEIQRTPEKSSTANLQIYHCQSPSVLNKSPSILSKNRSFGFKGSNSSLSLQNRINNSTNSSNSDKTLSVLGEKLNILNTQLSISRHFDDFEEIKENCPSPYATCRTAATNQNDIDTEMELSDDDVFATCKQIQVNYKKNP